MAPRQELHPVLRVAQRSRRPAVLEVAARFSSHLQGDPTTSFDTLLCDLVTTLRPARAVAWAWCGEDLVVRSAWGVDADKERFARLKRDADRAGYAALFEAADAGAALGDRPAIPLSLPGWPEGMRGRLLPLGSGGTSLGVVALGFDRKLGQDDNVLLGLINGLLSAALEREQAAEGARSREELVRLSTLGQLAATVTHELRGPLGALNLLLPQLRLAAGPAQDRLPDDFWAILEDVELCATKLTDLGEQMRTASRRDVQSEVFGIAELLSEVVDLATLHAKGHRIRIASRFQDGSVEGLRSQLGQVVLNLLLNAIDACADLPDVPHVITVESFLGPDDVKIRVCDTGPGIPEAVRDEIFEPFVTTKTKVAGTGLGLSVARDITHAHGGTLEIGPPIAGGATFLITLPRAKRAHISYLRPLARGEDPDPPTYESA